MSKAYIVSTGIICAIGEDARECLHSLQNGKHGIGRAQFLQSNWVNERPVGEVKLSSQQLADNLNTTRDWPRTALLSGIAVKEAWSPFARTKTDFAVGFLSANTVGGMDKTEDFFGDFLKDNKAGELRDFVNHECGAVTNLVAEFGGFKGFTTTVSTACSSSANSIMMAAQMIRDGLLDVAVAGGADSLCRFTLNGFNTLGILDNELCKPFDANRKGLNLGEGAAYLVLMSEKAVEAYGAEPIAIVSGWGNANDAHHQTASSPEGAGNKLAIQAAIDCAGLLPEDISYINLHGTGTENNDSSEGLAIEAIFGENVPPASSTKAFTGHTLGASGAVEAVFSTIALRDGIIYPNLRFKMQMPELTFRPNTRMEEAADVQHVLSNSFGFGGACTSLIFSKC
ncbi:MAG: beta-ketoacyl-[acyl-carrier-protein] synthase family protein [Chitinophagaceae bacterium]